MPEEMKLKKKYKAGRSYKAGGFGKKKAGNSGGPQVGGRRARARSRAPR